MLGEFALSAPKLAFTAEGSLPYNCWPNKLRYDETRDQFVMLYNANTTHIADGDSFIKCRTLQLAGNSWSEPITVADLNTSNIYVECNGFVVLPSGDYIAYVATRAGSNVGTVGVCNVYRSQDGGATWALLGPLAQSGVSVTPWLVAHAEYLASGHIYLSYLSSSSNTYIVKVSASTPKDYEPGDVVLISRTAIGSPTICGEGRFIDLGSGSIVCVQRKDINGVYGTNMRPIFTKTTDSGATWSDWAHCTPVATEMTNGNMDCIANGDGTFDLYWSSRRGQLDGLGQIWCSRVTTDQLGTGDIGRPSRLLTGPNTRDFGYPGVAQTPDAARRILTWYGGIEDDTDIFWLDMQAQADQRNEDYTPGAHVRGVTGATRTD